MAIIIKDDTANSVVLTIDNNGNLAFADGTPISALTLAGYGVIDSDGYIVHGFGSSAVIPASGMVHVPTNEIVTVSTIPGQIPIVALDTTVPAVIWDVDPSQDGHTTQTVSYEPNHRAGPSVGGFYVECRTVALDGRILEPGSAYYQSTLAAGTDVGYRWI
jgi:hypothetical protein